MTNYYTLRVHNAEIKDLWRKRSVFKGRFTRPSPYVKISVGDLVQRSSIAEKTVIPTWDDELPILCSGGGPKINIEILQDSVLAKGEYLYRPDNENERSGAKLRVDLRSHKDKIIKSSSFIMFSINPSDANGIAELAIKKLIQAVYGNNDKASTVDEMIQRGAAGYQSDLASLFKESTPFVDVFMKNMDELAGAHPYLKLAWSITSVAYKAVHSQIEFDKQVKELIEELVRTFRVIRDAAQIRRPLESFTAATSELLDLVIRLCIFIREYVRRDFIGRTLHVNDRVVITEFRTKLGTLKTNLDEAFSRQNVVISSRAADDTLRKRLKHDLNPVYMSGGDRPGCLDGTRVNLLQEIERWIHNKDQPNIFLLVGSAGTGKSTVATTIAERYRLKKQLGCHLFFMRGKSDPKSVICTMAYSLASLSQTIAEDIADNLRDHGEIKSATMTSQFEMLLHGPLHSSAKAESDAPVLIVLDALDECGTKESRGLLLQILKKGLPALPPKYRFLLTSRPEVAMIPFLSLPTVHSVVLDNASQDSKDDVRTYITSSLEKLREDGELKVPRGWPWEDNIERLSKAAEGLFIWASTALKFINGGENNQLLYLEGLIGNPKALNLNELYETVLKTSVVWDEHTKEVFPGVFSLILYGTRPLTDNEIDGILGLREGMTESLLSRLRSLVSYEPNHPIRVHHASFHDYLVSCKGMNWYINIDTQKEYIAVKCFERMGRLLRFNICDLESSFIFNKDVHDLEDRIRKNIPSYLQYICCNWIYHLQDVSFSHRLSDYIQTFVFNQLLFWFEVLSLTGKFSTHAGATLLYTIAWIGGQNTQLSTFLRDAYRQACTFSDPISQSTPHIYSTLLPLMKEISPVIKSYSSYSNPASRVEYVGGLPHATFVKEIGGATNDSWVNFFSISPDGTRLVSCTRENSISIKDATSGEPIIGPLEGHSNHITTISYSPNGKLIASGSYDKNIQVWDATTGKLTNSLLQNHANGVDSLSFSRDGKLIASGSLDRAVRIWDLETGRLVGEPLIGHEDGINSVSFSPDGLFVVSGSRDKTIIIWNVRNMNMNLDPLRKHTDAVLAVEFSPDGKSFVSCSDDGSVFIWNSFSGEIIREFPKYGTFGVPTVTYTPDGQFILLGLSSGMMDMWDVFDTTMPPRRFKAHFGPVEAISFARDNTRFVTSAYDGKIRIWDLADDMFDTEPSEIQMGMLRSVAISPSGQYIASGSNDKTICIWDAHSGELVSGPWAEHTGWITSVAFSPDETRVASGAVDCTIKLWNTLKGDPDTLVGHTGGVMSVVFSPNGEYIASGSRDTTIRVWDVRRRELAVRPFKGHSNSVQSVVYSADGTKIISGSLDTTVRIWDSLTGELLSLFTDNSLMVYCVAISPDGTRIASGSGTRFDDKYGHILVWDTKSGKLVCGPIEAHNHIVLSLCFSPDGKRILSASRDKTVCMLDATTGNSLRTFRGHTKPVNSVCIFPDGRRFASSADDGTFRTWTIDRKPINIEWQKQNIDGWVVGENDELLIWLPPYLRGAHPTPGTINIFNQSLQTRLFLPDSFSGDKWNKCCTKSVK